MQNLIEWVCLTVHSLAGLLFLLLLHGCSTNLQATEPDITRIVDASNTDGASESSAIDIVVSDLPGVDSLSLDASTSLLKTIWSFHGGGDGADYARSCGLDGKGALYVAGAFNSKAVYQNIQISPLGGYDVFILKLLTSGLFSWVRSAGGPGGDSSRNMSIQGPDSIFLTGFAAPGAAFGSEKISSTAKDTYYMARFNSGGNFTLLRSTEKNSGESWGSNVAFDSEGGIYVIGRYKGSMQLGAKTLQAISGWDAFLAKYRPNGDLEFAHSIGGKGDDAGGSVKLDGAGNVYVTIHIKGSSSIKAFGKTIPVSASNGHIIIKAEASLSVKWSVPVLGSMEQLYELAVDKAGNSWFAGSYMGANATFGGVKIPAATGTDPDIFVGKISTSGTIQWIRVLKAPSSKALVMDLVLDDKSNVYMAGSFAGKASIGGCTLSSHMSSYDLFSLKLDSKGACKWAVPVGGDKYDGGWTCVAVDSAGDVYMAGGFQGSMILGSKTLTSLGDADTFVWKFKQP